MQARNASTGSRFIGKGKVRSRLNKKQQTKPGSNCLVVVTYQRKACVLQDLSSRVVI
jgi:hypothetical protein